LFVKAGSNANNHIAGWSGSAWYTIQGGMDNTVDVLYEAPNGLYAGGAFTLAGSTAANSVAIWGNILSVYEEKELPGIRLFPNPFDEAATIELIDPAASLSGVFELYDCQGTLVRCKAIKEKSFEIKKEDLPSGLYFYRLRNNDKLIACGKFIIR
jgi:hypothetical protein